MNFAILASTNGTNIPAIISAFKNNSIKGEVVCGIVNTENCGARKKLINEKISTFFIDHKGKKREEFDNEVSITLKQHFVDYIICVGYMRIFSPEFVQDWRNKILNVHPSLLPDFPGAHAVSDAMEAGVKKTGASIHFIDEGVDTGKILAQKSVEIHATDTLESLKEKIQKVEQNIYVEVLQKLSNSTLFQKS